MVILKLKKRRVKFILKTFSFLTAYKRLKLLLIKF